MLFAINPRNKMTRLKQLFTNVLEKLLTLRNRNNTVSRIKNRGKEARSIMFSASKRICLNPFEKKNEK